MLELKNSKTTHLDGKRFALDCHIGAVQMREPEGNWQDIKPQLVRDTDGWHIEGAPYYAEVKDDGTRLFCPDRNERSKYLRLPTIGLFRNLIPGLAYSPTKIDGQILPNRVVMPAPWGEIRFIFTTSGMNFESLFRQAPTDSSGRNIDRFTFDQDTAGFDILQLLNSKQGLGIPRPRLIELAADPLEMRERWLDWSYKVGQLELGFDLTGLKFPVLLKNTSIEDQVGASADDADELESTGAMDLTDVYVVNRSATASGFRYWGGYRFTSPTGSFPSVGDTIDTAHIHVYVYSAPTGDDANFNIHFEELAAPAAFTTTAGNITSRDRTEQSASWIAAGLGVGWEESPSLVTPLQEVVNAYSPTTIVVITRPNQDTAQILYAAAYDYDDHSYAAQLHIEYTAAGIKRGWWSK